ncbi:MAG: peptidylprolyl isomerase [Candidatus Krumholzibacteriia bacterium]
MPVRHLAPLLVLIAVVGPATVRPTVAAADPSPVPVPLAIVADDTLTTRDLDVQLSIMRQRLAGDAEASLPPADAVLRRLIQNQLLIQEGYRLGLDASAVVSSQVIEAVRDQSTKALLDSVADAAAPPTPEQREVRHAAVKAFVDGLMTTYGVVIDSTLLRACDFATEDRAALEAMSDSEAVLAVIPSGPIKVKNLAREIRFKEYHGLQGKPDAAERRDRIFRELLIESLLRYEARTRGVENHPEIRRLAHGLEQQLVLEEAMKVLLPIEFKPTSAEVEAYYQAHLAEYTPGPRVKVEGVKFADEAAARRFRDRLLSGAKLEWLRRNTDGIMDTPPPFPPIFFDPATAGIAPADCVKGRVLDIFTVPNGFVVAVVQDVQGADATPLEQCRQRVLAQMKAEMTQAHVKEILARLEDATPVTIVPGAEAVVAETIAAAMTSR